MFTLIIVPCALPTRGIQHSEANFPFPFACGGDMDHDHDGSNQYKFERLTSHGLFNEFEINFSIFIEPRRESSCK